MIVDDDDDDDGDDDDGLMIVWWWFDDSDSDGSDGSDDSDDSDDNDVFMVLPNELYDVFGGRNHQATKTLHSSWTHPESASFGSTEGALVLRTVPITCI